MSLSFLHFQFFFQFFFQLAKKIFVVLRFLGLFWWTQRLQMSKRSLAQLRIAWENFHSRSKQSFRHSCVRCTEIIFFRRVYWERVAHREWGEELFCCAKNEIYITLCIGRRAADVWEREKCERKFAEMSCENFSSCDVSLSDDDRYLSFSRELSAWRRETNLRERLDTLRWINLELFFSFLLRKSLRVAPNETLSRL